MIQCTDRTSVFAQYPVFLANQGQETQKTTGVQTAVHDPVLLHHQPENEDICPADGEVPFAEILSARVMSLPISANLSAADRARIVTAS